MKKTTTRKPQPVKSVKSANQRNKRRKSDKNGVVRPKSVGTAKKKTAKASKRSGRKPNRSKPRKKKKSSVFQRMKENLVAVIISIVSVSVIFFLLSLFLFAVPKAEGYGMASLIEENDRLYVNKLGKIKRFSLIYFQVPGRKNEVSVRRVIGLPGDQLYFKGDTLFVNNEEKKERFLTEEKAEARKEGYQLTEDFTSKDIAGTEKGVIPKGKYLVLGDNRTFATDSRYYGLVDEKEIIGTVAMKILPLHEMTKF